MTSFAEPSSEVTVETQRLFSSRAQGGTLCLDWGDRILMAVSSPPLSQDLSPHTIRDVGIRAVEKPGKEKIQIVPLCSVFAFPHHGIDTWTPEPSRPMPEPGRQERASGAGCRTWAGVAAAALGHGSTGPRQASPAAPVAQRAQVSPKQENRLNSRCCARS